MDLLDASNTYFIDDNDLWIGPGEEKELLIRFSDAVDGVDRKLTAIKVSGFNVDEIVVVI